MQITAQTFAVPAMRPHLEKYYNQKKEDFAKALAERDPLPETVTLPDGSEGKPLTLSVDMLVSFDKWLELMQKHDLFAPAQRLEQARENLARLESMSPDSPAGVTTVFSRDDRILVYFNDEGSIVLHSDAQFLQNITDKDELIKRLKAAFPDLDITEYTPATQLTKREFAAKWYPDAPVDANYREAVAAARDHLKSMEEWALTIQKNHDQMGAFLLQSMEESQAA